MFSAVISESTNLRQKRVRRRRPAPAPTTVVPIPPTPAPVPTSETTTQTDTAMSTCETQTEEKTYTDQGTSPWQPVQRHVAVEAIPLSASVGTNTEEPETEETPIETQDQSVDTADLEAHVKQQKLRRFMKRQAAAAKAQKAFLALNGSKLAAQDEDSDE